MCTKKIEPMPPRPSTDIVEDPNDIPELRAARDLDIRNLQTARDTLKNLEIGDGT